MPWLDRCGFRRNPRYINTTLQGRHAAPTGAWRLRRKGSVA